MTSRLSKSALFATLPPPWPEDLRPQIRAAVAAQREHKLVVIDDDPTGTQTVYDVPVLTSWETETLRVEFSGSDPCFYIITNSRSLPPEAARALTLALAGNLQSAAGTRPFTLVSRSDSTLRGHFPLETDALAEVLGPFDATLLIPYFEDGGRYTVGDIHYVAEGDALIPAAETPFARDAAFGFRSSRLPDYVEEKSAGRVRAGDVLSIGLADLRQGGPDVVTSRLLALTRGSLAVINVAAPRDLDVFVVGVLRAEAQGRRFCFRTAAQFPAARLGLDRRATLTARDLVCGGASNAGGLIVVGSHVPMTTSQLEALAGDENLLQVELHVDQLLSARRRQILEHVSAVLTRALSTGRDALVFTSRRFIGGNTPGESLQVAQRISSALVELVERITIRPRYILAKGGITSSDVATRGLGVKRALVAGQLLTGVPVWRLGIESRFPNLPYIVFPGNVGGPTALADAVHKLRLQSNS
jgi:uncharacterized protein YgbK (DUF1537 family)